jgi:hypothetical protein
VCADACHGQHVPRRDETERTIYSGGECRRRPAHLPPGGGPPDGPRHVRPPSGTIPRQSQVRPRGRCRIGLQQLQEAVPAEDPQVSKRKPHTTLQEAHTRNLIT